MLEIGDARYIIDMGTQAIDLLRARNIPIESVRGVFCTHPHGDHTDGVLSFVDLCNWYFRDAEPTVLLPNQELIDALKAYLAATGVPLRPEFKLGVYHAGVIYEDDIIRVTAIPTQHCKNAHAFFVEAEGKKLLFTGDLKHPTVDFPKVAFEEETDLIVCESAHFSPHDSVKVLEQTKTKRVIINHIAPYRYVDLFDETAKEHPFLLEDAFDGMEVTL